MFLDLSNIEASGTPQPLPPGDYLMQIDTAEVKATKDGKGKFINLKLKVTGGACKGRTVYHRFNIQNASEKAQQIGLSQLKSMMLAMGMNPVLESVTDLIGGACIVRTKLGKNQNNEPQAEVASFLSLDAVADEPMITGNSF